MPVDVSEFLHPRVMGSPPRAPRLTMVPPRSEGRGQRGNEWRRENGEGRGRGVYSGEEGGRGEEGQSQRRMREEEYGEIERSRERREGGGDDQETPRRRERLGEKSSRSSTKPERSFASRLETSGLSQRGQEGRKVRGGKREEEDERRSHRDATSQRLRGRAEGKATGDVDRRDKKEKTKGTEEETRHKKKKKKEERKRSKSITSERRSKSSIKRVSSFVSSSLLLPPSFSFCFSEEHG